ncbi:cytokinin dehydrogenase 5 [Phalaenopsis equestris]|uniref:cytokinin dehydrogenase 5 n=1 Tax=Phalaenopsis equestris TaxID=78828 RepID=UPI0009E35F6B|nr:cytokinin dehydrogenase 5 [Phalaenopsis equestris]
MPSAAHNLLIHLLISISTVGSTLSPSPSLTFLPSQTHAAAVDFGSTTHSLPLAVLLPSSPSQISSLILSALLSPPPPPQTSSLTLSALLSSPPLSVSPRGHGHSLHGQAGAPGGVVISMTGGGGRRRMSPPANSIAGNMYVDVWGGELWIDVLNWTLKNGGLAPRSWTDYLYLSVGGTLSNAGVSGQAFHHGPQISNVFELDVVTGKGELVTCSLAENAELFHAVLGGLGQFGIITRARIALEPAPQRVRWIRVLYSNFTSFTRDQERLISLHNQQRFDYIEGFVIAEEGLINNWRSSFFSPSNPPVTLSSIGGRQGAVLYCLELTKNYHHSSSDSIDEEVEALLRELDFIRGSVFTTDLAYVDFLDRVHKAELKLRAKGLWEVPHPWLNIFVPASRIEEFDRGVFRGILGNNTSGPILIYPMNKDRWDERSSVVLPDEDIFYLVALLRSVVPGSDDPSKTLEYLSDQNRKILEFSESAGIGAKQYLPSHRGPAEWERHFGPARWERFLRRKAEFDPSCLLGTGQSIFHPSSCPFSSFLSPT